MLALRLSSLKLQTSLTAHPQAIVALYAGVLFFVMLGSARTFTHHESHVVQGAREMLATGDWLIPRVGGLAWLEKPPLPQWCVALSGALLGEVNAFSARLPAALAALFGLLAVTGLVQRTRGSGPAILTGIALATMTSIITYARLAEPDIFLWAIVMLALAVFARAHVEPTEARSWRSSPILFFALLGLTQTVKGPIFGAVMVLAPLFAWFAVHRLHHAKWCVSPIGWLIGVLLAFAWPVAVLLQYPEALELWKYHTLGRLDASTAYNAKPLWYYLTTLPWQAAPAILFALPALPRSWKAAWNDPRSLDRFLWLWTGSQLLVLSLASGKHHHYLLYALPPFAVWASAGLLWYRDRIRRLWGLAWWRVGSILISLFVLGMLAVLLERRGVMAWPETLAVGGCFLAGTILLSHACRDGRNGLAAAAWAVTLAGVLLYANTVWLSRTDIYKPDGELGRRLEALTQPNEIIIIYSVDPARLLLDMHRRVDVIKEPDALRAALAERPHTMIVTAVYYTEEIRDVTPIVEVDRTPQAKWPGRPLSHLVAFRTQK